MNGAEEGEAREVNPLSGSPPLAHSRACPYSPERIFLESSLLSFSTRWILGCFATSGFILMESRGKN